MNAAGWIELVILAAGTALLLAGAIRFTLQRSWLTALRLPPMPPLALQSVDGIVVILLFLGTGSLLLNMATLFLGEAPASAATTTTGDNAPAPGTRPVLALVNVAAPFLNIAMIYSLARFRFRPSWGDWGLTTRRWGRDAVTAVAVYLATWPVCTLLLSVTTRIYGWFGIHDLPEHGAIRILLSEETPPWIRAGTILSAVVLAPVLEEMVFRGVLMRLLAEQSRSIWSGILLSGLVFGLVHVTVPQTVPALVFFGVILGMVYARTGSLTAVIFLHIVFNAKTVVGILLGAGP